MLRATSTGPDLSHCGGRARAHINASHADHSQGCLMFISPAYAQEGDQSGMILQFLPIVLIFVVFYFLLIRPQQKKHKEHKIKVQAVRRGDRVVTGGGLIGTVTRIVDDSEIVVEIAENTRVRVRRDTLMDVVSKPGAADEPAKKGEDDDGTAVKRRGRLGRKAAED